MYVRLRLLVSEKILAHTRSETVKSKEGQMTPTLQTEEEKLCLVGARCLHENHPDVIARQARLLQRLQVDRIGGSAIRVQVERENHHPSHRRKRQQRRWWVGHVGRWRRIVGRPTTRIPFVHCDDGQLAQPQCLPCLSAAAAAGAPAARYGHHDFNGGQPWPRETVAAAIRAKTAD
ncbi:hypothetical protein HPB51_004052 [Rhipicephalus microplus]|uniref:Uncharacterized protein n=1 Tax=Rhipicephalus microplus TaxID=6941 RepID=A0A9J6EXJ3_RHIMP|nr:hypothetical protein HPB51_004052 [Rhipicephalus microplus]